MHTRLHIKLRAAAVAAALIAAPAAHAQMYRWMDAQGAFTYSNQLPKDLSTVRDLTVVLGNPDKHASDLPHVESHPATAGNLPPPSEPHAAPRIVVAPGAPEAVRDPCLRSPDPKCYEHNKAAYVPYRGYSSGSGVGATASTGAGGTISGGSPPPAKITAPKSSLYALPPGSEAGAALPRR